MNARKGVLLLLIAALSVLSFMLVRPYIPYLLAAVLLAYVLAPLQRRLEPKVGGTWAAATVVLAATIALLIPLAVMIVTIAGEAAALAGGFSATELAAQIEPIERWISETLGRDVDLAAELSGRLEALAESMLGSAPNLVAAFTHAAVGTGLAVFVVFYTLRDRRRLLGWIRDVTPLPETVQQTLFEQLDEMTRAVLLGHVLVAIIQGVLAGVGLLVVGISNVVFWTAAMIVLSLLPLVGSFLVWGPAVVYLLWAGSPLMAGFLFVYGTIVVGVSDEYLRPLIVDRYTSVSPAIIVVGVLGGLAAFGVMGLFFGPIIVGALKTAIEVFDDHYTDL